MHPDINVENQNRIDILKVKHKVQEKPRLLFIVGRFVIGGHAIDNIPLLFFLKDYYTIQIIYGAKEPDEMEPIFLLEQYPGLDIQKLPTLKRRINPFADLISLAMLYVKIKKFKPDIIHTHGSKSGFSGRIAGWIFGHAVLVHTFHGHLFHSYFNSVVTRLLIFVERMLASITDAAIALGPAQKRELVDDFKIFPERKVYEIPLGMVAPNEHVSTKESLRSLYNVSNDEVVIAIIGRIVPIKNHLDFLKIACDVLASGVQGVSFFIIGDGNDRKVLEEFLSARGYSFSVSGSVAENAKFIFTSWISDMYSVIEEIDIVALTSSNEGTPVSLIEAQLFGKPVVAYNVGGVKDTFIHNTSGWLVEKGDLADFSAKLFQLVANKELRTEMGRCGKEYALEKFSKSAEVAAVNNLYTNLLKQHSRIR